MEWITEAEVNQMHGISKLRRAILRWLCKKGSLLKGRVLNVGAGGDMYKYRRYLPNATEYVCLDKCKTANIDIVADAENMSTVPSDSFDSVVSTSMLYYLEHPSRALGEIHRVLKSGGIALLEFIGPGWRMGGGGDGIWRFTPRQVRELCECFEVIGFVEFRYEEEGAVASCFVTLRKACKYKLERDDSK